jgi:hypothetical protein
MADLISTGSMTVIAEQLAGRIRAAHQAASTAAQTALGHALEAGRLLAEARDAVPHGGWAGYVASCGIADRTASLYMRLHRHRDRLEDRQRVADLSVRQAARLLAEPKAEKVIEAVIEPAGGCAVRSPVTAARAKAESLEAERILKELRDTRRAAGLSEPAGVLVSFGEEWLSADDAHERSFDVQGLRFTVALPAGVDVLSEAEAIARRCNAAQLAKNPMPSWYRPGHRHAGTHPSGACFMVWPHPAGEPWVHAFVVIPHDPASPDSGGLLEGPKRGIRVDRVLNWLEFKRGGGLPDMRDPSWVIGDPQPVTPEEIAAEPHYNTWLFSSPDDYRRRGLGIIPRPNAEKGVKA